ncbi:MAG: VOC family protein [Paracoccaceae bacterium]
MSCPVFFILYVADTANSADFYARHFGGKVGDVSETFGTVALNDGAILGLWKRDTVAPSPTGAVGAVEIAQNIGDAVALDSRHAALAAAGVSIMQPPVDMPFGRNFVVSDPDGHRIRFMAA